MSYSDFYLKTRNKPPAALYLLAVLAIGGFAATFFRPSTPTAQASKENVVYNTMANISTHQAGVYYQTANPTKSWVIYGTDPNRLDRAAFDDRDTQQNTSQYMLHFVLLKDLQENTKYSYKIIANNEIVSINGVSSFSFTTPPTAAIGNVSSVDPAYGKVLQQNNDPVNNGFVLYYYPGAYPLISPIKGGDWLIALNSLINRKTGKMVIPKPTESVKLEIIDESLHSTTIETLLGNTTPLSKTVIIGTAYEKTSQEGVLAAEDQVTKTITPTIKSPSPTAVISSNIQSDGVEITFPKENAIIPGNNPLIKGVGVSKAQVAVSIRSPRQTILSTKVTVESDGTWSVKLPMPLQPATYTLGITTKNSSGRTVSLSRVFTTTKSGEAVVLGDATSSATLTPPTPIPTLIAEATTVPTAIPTVPVTTTPPVTGENNNLIIAGSLALVIIAAGVILLF